jgi:hypothetical protein
MAYLTGTIEFKVYTDSAQTEFPQELVPSIKKEFSDNSISEVQATTISLPASGSQAINLNGVATVKRWYLYTDASSLTLTINGSATTFTYNPGIPGFIPMTLTSLSITNDSASAATNVTLVLVTGA